MSEIPVPGLVVLIGAAGAGKSTLAARLFAPDEILSSDELRAAISGDPTDQRATRPAFSILHREARRRLLAGRLVVVDATNAERSARLPLVRLARDVGAPTVAIAILAAPADVHDRNLGRPERVVPAEVVDRHLARLARLGPDPRSARETLLVEGFAEVHVVTTTADLDRLGPVQRVESRRGPSPEPAQVRPAGDQSSRTRPNGRARSSTHTPFRR